MDDRYSVVRPVMTKRRAAVAVPFLHRVGHVNVKREIWREHAIVAAQNAKVLSRRVPKPLELVVVYGEMAPCAALVGLMPVLREVKANEPS